MKIESLYLAHPVVGDATGLTFEQIAERIKANLARASRWLAWIVRNTNDVAIRCSWIGYIGGLPETPELRERGLRDDDSEVATCTGIVLCGGYLSSGMKRGARTLINAPITPAELLINFARTGVVHHEPARYTGDGDPGCVGSCHACAAESVLKNLPPPRSRYILDLIELGDEPPDWSPEESQQFLRQRLIHARAIGYSGKRSRVEVLA